MNKKLLIGIVAVLALLVGGYFVWTQDSPEPIDTTTESQDSSSYRIVNDVFAVDDEHVYVYGAAGKGTSVLMPKADVKTFVSTGSTSAKDANHTYDLDAKGYLLVDGKFVGGDGSGI